MALRRTRGLELKATLRAKTKRDAGRSLRCIIADVNARLRGWLGYFKHSYHTTFPNVDGWIRGRLRSILRKRAGRRGPGPGTRSLTLAQLVF